MSRSSIRTYTNLPYTQNQKKVDAYSIGERDSLVSKGVTSIKQSGWTSIAKVLNRAIQLDFILVMKILSARHLYGLFFSSNDYNSDHNLSESFQYCAIVPIYIYTHVQILVSPDNFSKARMPKIVYLQSLREFYALNTNAFSSIVRFFRIQNVLYRGMTIAINPNYQLSMTCHTQQPLSIINFIMNKAKCLLCIYSYIMINICTSHVQEYKVSLKLVVE